MGNKSYDQYFSNLMNYFSYESIFAHGFKPQNKYKMLVLSEFVPVCRVGLFYFHREVAKVSQRINLNC